jgi:hypothetical protein
MKFLTAAFFSAFCIFSFTDCSKAPNSTPALPPVDSVQTTVDSVQTNPPSPDFRVDNSWECTIDGVFYSGTIDTSFTTNGDLTYIHPDTVIICTGTSHDKKANIYFYFHSNGTLTAHESITEFDTTSPDLLTSIGIPPSALTYSVDSFRYDKVKATFSGTLYSGTSFTPHNVTNGKLSCKFDDGNSEPKKFSFTSDITGSPIGYLNSAVLVSNTLILDGSPYYFYSRGSVRLQIRTGQNIKPGTYSSKDGDVGFFYFSPYQYRNYVADSVGDMNVVITNADDGIVTGNFSGTDFQGYPISNGYFRCRVKNYVPGITDSLNQWKINYMRTYQDFRMYGGNILKAKLSREGDKNILSLNGNSDYGTSTFKIQLSSTSPIVEGDYSVSNYHTFPRKIDSFYFTSNEQILNGRDVYIGADSKTIITIDSIDASGVTGHISTTEPSYEYFIPGFKRNSFKAAF